MIVECLAIISIVLAMAFIFLRAGKRVYASGILPLILLPLVQMASTPISNFICSFIPASMISVRVGLVFSALIIACTIMGFLGSKIRGKGSRTVYFIICGVFTLTLAMIFILDAIKKYV